jgi:PAS domain S-box-containing protein
MLEAFEVTQKIYQSANSIIYRASNSSTVNEVILKVINRTNPTPLETGRFRNEFRLAKQFEHANIIKVFDLITFGNAPAIVMEDFGGESLYRIWDSDKYSLEQKLSISYRIGSGIEEIHRRNTIHKDVNPSNIVWCPQLDTVKIIDFGISTNLSEETHSIQNPATLEGTLAFMAPEQTGRMNRSIDYRSDLYSFGCTLYWLFTGRFPFDETDPIKLIHAHIALAPENPRHISEDLPDVIAKIILKLMSKDVDERYQSAAGVKSDLMKCLQELKLEGQVEPFEIGKSDKPTRFQIPKKLYGRERHAKAILSTFEQVCEAGESAFTLVSGSSGVGKTVLVGEVNKIVVAKKGLFLSGKFSQMELMVPHRGIIQVFSGLFKNFLSEPEERLNEWKTKINAVVYPNGKILTDMIPDAELVMGPQPDLMDLPPRESENRFLFILQNIVEVFAQRNHPLVLFFDDLQWSDISTLSLIEGLLTSKIKYLYVIGAYRDNEISESSPLVSLIEKIRNCNLNLSEIKIGSLQAHETKSLVEDALKTNDDESAAELAELCQIKTKGNPFHLVQLLMDLYAKGIFSYSLEARAWVWSKEQIANLELMDDVVAFIISKLRRLSIEAQKTIIAAACIDNIFNLDKIKHACGHDAVTIHGFLSEAINDGLIIPSENYKYIEGFNDGVDIHFRFLHDRVRQAAYELIPTRERDQYHRTIGLKFLSQFRLKNASINIFDVVKQLNHLAGSLDRKSERLELAQLNLDAGEKAKASSAWKQAFEYFHTGLRLSVQDDWESSYDLVFCLHARVAEAACLIADFETVEQITARALSKAKTILDKSIIWEIQLSALIAKGRPVEVTELGLSALDRLGVRIRPNVSKIGLVFSLFKAKNSLGRITEGLGRKKMTDQKILAASKILMKISSSAYLAGKKEFVSVILHSVKLIKQYGFYSDTAYGLVSFAGILSVIGDFDAAAKFAALALKVAKEDDSGLIRAKTIYLAHAFTKVWTEPYKNTAAELVSGYHSGIETGDFEFAAFNIYCHYYLRFLSGEQLASIEAGMMEYETKIKSQDTVWSFFSLYHQLVMNLRSNAADPTRLKGESCDEDVIIGNFKARGNKVGLFDIYTKKMMLAYLLYQHENAEEASIEVEKYADAAMAKHDLPVAVFYQSLQISEALKRTKSIAINRLPQLKRNLRKMKKWARHAPENYRHKHMLMLAEVKGAEGKAKQAHRFYKKALAMAESSGIVHEEALCLELLALHHKASGQLGDYEQCIIKAFDRFKHWGALTKCRAMKSRYPKIFKKSLKCAIEPVQQYGHMEPTLRANTGETTETTELLKVDLLSVIRASQAISMEMDTGCLAERMLQIVIENTGAQKGIFFIENANGQLMVKAVKNGSPGRESSNHPASVVNFAIRTNEVVVLDDAASEGSFCDDEYIKQRNIKSLLCIPFLRNGKAIGVLYLENRQTSRAFTKDRILLLKTIATQAAIFIENCQLYDSVTKSEARYRGIVENAMDGIFQSTPEGKLLTANKALAEIFGYENAEQMSKEVDDLARCICAEPNSRESFSKQMERYGLVRDFEIEFRKKGCAQIAIGMLNAYAVRDKSGKSLYYEGTLKDITERKQIEALKIEKEKAEIKASMKSRFMAHMSHEIRTPLNTILGYTQLLKEVVCDCVKAPNTVSMIDYIDHITSSGRHLLALINEILDFSKLEAGKPILKFNPFSLESMLRRLSDEFKDKIQTKGLTFEVESDSGFESEFIRFDETRLRQILINLIDNAFKYTATGYVKLCVQKKMISANRINLVLIVEDSGIGISDTNSIFEEFEQAQKDGIAAYAGTGLGLAIVKKLVEILGGTISVYSSMGNGSLFTVAFKDVEIVELDNLAKSSDHREIIFEPATIIAADDNADNRKLIKDYLFGQPIAVIEAEHGAAAIDLLKSESADLILMDLKMPTLDGYEAARAIKRVPGSCQIPIIGLTADITDEARNKALCRGCDGYLLKPVSKYELFDEMKRFLSHQSIEKPKKTPLNKSVTTIPLDVNERPQLVEALKKAEKRRCRVVKTMIIRDVEEFASEIVSAGQLYGSNAISKWGRRLKEYAVNFSKQKIEVMMRSYPDLVEKVETGATQIELMN